MRMMIHLICGLTAVAAAAGDDMQLKNMLATAATNRGSAYLEARTKILASGTNALPSLGRCAIATDLTWQQRLVARICYERLSRSADIAALWAYDWRTDKGYDKRWENFINGPAIKMGTIIVPRCREVGLWYYYIELAWKETAEIPVCGKCLKPIPEGLAIRERLAEMERRAKEGLRSCIHQDSGFCGSWARWCLEAVANEPERYWYRLTVEERMVASPFSDWHIGRYETFLREKDPETVPVLVQFYDAYKSSISGLEMYPGARAEGYKNVFIPILALADSRHADLLEKFISEKPALEPLKNRVAEVRARPAPPPVAETPFRLGKELVIVK